jgi:hypothetical protein
MVATLVTLPVEHLGLGVTFHAIILFEIILKRGSQIGTLRYV